MKKLLLVTLLASSTVFAQNYSCNFTLVRDMNSANPQVQDSAKLNLNIGGSDETRLQIAKKSIKVKIDKISETTFKGQMFLTAWVSDNTDVGPMDNEGFIAGSVSASAKVVQLSTQIKGEYYNLVCTKN